MKRFRFPLRPVAVLRAHLETRAREAFASAMHRYVQSEQDLMRARVRMRALEAELFSGRAQRFRADEAALLLADYRRECGAEVETERRMIAARDEMEQRRKDYIEAHRKLEVVHRLEAKARSAYRREAEREEQAEFDDFAGRRRIKPFPFAT
jgi:Flagellar FliJ protein.